MDELAQLKPGDVLGQVDLGSYIGAMGKGVAEAQRALDDNTVGLLGAFTKPVDSLEGKSLIQLGLSPAFYHFRAATVSASVNMSIRVRQEIDVEAHFDGSRSSSSSSTQTTDFTDVSNTTQSFHVSEGVEAHAAATGSVMERLDSYASSNSNQRLIVAERTIADQAQSFQTSGIARYNANAALFVVPPPGRRWAVLKIPATSAANAIQIRATGVAHPPSATTTAQAFASGLSSLNSNGIAVALVAVPTATNPLLKVKFNTGSYVVKNAQGIEYAPRLRILAHILAATGAAVTLVGRTDGVGTMEYNQKLSKLRAEAVRDVLVANGVADNKISLKWIGEQGVPDNKNDPEARNVTITFDAEPTEFYAFLWETQSNAMAALAVGTICVATGVYGASGTVSGATVTTAAEVATAVNAGAQTQASQFNELVYLTNKENSAAKLATVTVFATQESSTDSNLGLDSSGDSQSSSMLNAAGEKIVNRAAAMAGSVGARFSRMFDVSMSGNMSVTAELVSIPAPPEFLQFIKDYLEE
jgi:outer membrane protein OmpA-like peptidoglycan-associated protein